MRKFSKFAPRLLSLVLTFCIMLGVFPVFAQESATVAYIGNTQNINHWRQTYPELLQEYMQDRLGKNVNTISAPPVDLTANDFMNSLVNDILPKEPDMVFVEIDISKAYKASETELIARLESMVLAMLKANKTPSIYFVYTPRATFLDNRAPFDKVAKRYEIDVIDAFSYFKSQYTQGRLKTSDFLVAGEYIGEAGHDHLARIIKDALNGKKDILKLPKTDASPLTSAKYGATEDVSPEDEVGALKADGTVLYVSANDGSDTNRGTIDEPLATITAAKDRIRKIKASQGPEFKGATVYIRGGRYNITDTLVFNEEDSGTNDAAIVYEGYGDEEVCITNAHRLNPRDFTAVTNRNILERIHPSALGDVIQYDLKSRGIVIGNYLSVKATGDRLDITQGLGSSKQLMGNILTADGRWQYSAQYPNGGYAFIASHQPSGAAKIAYSESDKNPRRWTKTDGNAYVRGMMGYGYFTFNTRLSSIDTEGMFLNLAVKPGESPRANWTWSVVNMLEELDTPGEYYADTASGILYYYPLENFKESEILFSSDRDDIFRLDKVKNVTFKNISFENCVGTAIEFNDGIQNTVDNCSFKNMGYFGIVFNHSGNTSIGGNKVINSRFSNLAIGAICFNGGDKATLVSQDDLVENCFFETYALVGHHGSAAVYSLDANGFTVRHCTFHNDDSHAIVMGSQEQNMEYNEFYNLLRDSDDTGVIYGQRNGFTSQGTRFAYNYLHDVVRDFEGPSSSNVFGYYADALGPAGAYVTNNVFVDVGRAIHTVGSPNYIIDGNLLLECTGNGIYTIDHYVGADRVTVSNFYKPYIESGTLDETFRGNGISGISVTLAQLFYYAYLQDKAFSGDNQKNYFKKYPWLEHYLDFDFKVHDITIRNNAIYNHQGSNIITVSPVDNTKFVSGNYLSTESFSQYSDPYERVNAAMQDAKANADGFVVWDVREAGIQTEDEEIGDFALRGPKNGETDVPVKDSFLTWDYSYGADDYRVEIATDPEFNNIVFDKVVRNNYVKMDGIMPGARQYYWRVSATSLCHKFTGKKYATDGVRTFTTVRFDEGDRDNLNRSVNEAQVIYDNMVEGDLGGQYPVGCKEKLGTVLENAKIPLEKSHVTPDEVTVAYNELNSTLIDILAQVNISDTNALDLLSADKVSYMVDSKNRLPVADNANVTQDGDTIVYKNKIMAITNDAVANHHVLHFTGKIDFTSEPGASKYSAIGLGSQNLGLNAWNITSYFVLITKDNIELQAFKLPSNVGKLYFNVPNEYIKHNTEFDMEFCAIPLVDGVRIILRIDGKIVYDYIDKNNAISKSGYAFVNNSSEGVSITIAPPKENLGYPSLAELLNDKSSELNTKVEKGE